MSYPQKKLVDGRFLMTCKRINGSEGSVEIRLAEDQELKRKCVVKMFSLLDETGKFYMECEMLRKLQHKYIIGYIHEVAFENNYLLIMEKGECSLSTLIEKDYGVVLNQFLLFSYQMAQSLAYIHRKGVIHGDLKFPNYIVVNNTVKLIDFGNATYYIAGFGKSNGSGGPSEVLSNLGKDVLDLGQLYFFMVKRKCLGDHEHETALNILQTPSTRDEIPQNYYGSRKIFGSDRTTKDVAVMIMECLNMDIEKRISSSELAVHPVFDQFNNSFSL